MIQKLLTASVALIVLFSTSLAQTKQKVQYPYLTYVPKSYANNTKQQYPLMIYLHGSSQRGSDLSMLKTYGMPYVIDKGAEFECIIISPQCPAGKQWHTDNWFEPMLKALKEKYRIDEKRIYITGVSMGGYGTYTTAIDFPDVFAAALPLCGWLDNAALRNICRINKLPIWTLHGTADNVIPVTETERIYAALQKCKANIEFTRLTDEGHQIHYLYDKNPDLFAWLFRHKKP